MAEEENEPARADETAAGGAAEGGRTGEQREAEPAGTDARAADGDPATRQCAAELAGSGELAADHAPAATAEGGQTDQQRAAEPAGTDPRAADGDRATRQRPAGSAETGERAAEGGGTDEQRAAEPTRAEGRAADRARAVAPDGGRDDVRRAGDLVAAAEGRAGRAEPGVEPDGRPERPYRWRGTVVSVLVALFAAYLLYRFLHDGELEQTALFYVGLPAVLAITVAATARPRSAVGAAVVATTVGLGLAGPLLGEGVICLVFSAPLFYLVAVFVGLIIEAARKAGSRGVTAIAIVPVALMCLEGVSPDTSMPRGETVSSERVVHANPEDVEHALAGTPTYGRPTSAFLRLGFPLPLRATGQGLDEGDERFVTFTPRRSLGIGAQPTPRSMRLRVTESRPGKVVFTIVQDSTAARWLDFETAEVTWHAARTGSTANTTVRWTLHYHRTFDPSWYFGPLQRYGMTRAAEYLNVTVTNPSDA